MADATFTWTPAAGATSQTIRWAASPYTVWSPSVFLTGTTSFYVALNLNYGTAYEFQITSICAAGAPTTISYFSTSPCSASVSALYDANVVNSIPATSLSCCAVNDVTWGVGNGILFPTIVPGAGAFNIDGKIHQQRQRMEERTIKL